MNEPRGESFAERMKRESNGKGGLDPAFVEREKREQAKYLIHLAECLGRPLTDRELYDLSNIL